MDALASCNRNRLCPFKRKSVIIAAFRVHLHAAFGGGGEFLSLLGAGASGAISKIVANKRGVGFENLNRRFSLLLDDVVFVG